MLNKKTNNFNDFSRYYSEENQELLEKKSKLAPYIIFSFLLILISFSYLLYTYILNQKNTTNTKKFEPKILTQTIPSTIPSSLPSVIAPSLETPSVNKETSLIIKQKENIKKLVIKKIQEEKIIEKHSEKQKESILINQNKPITVKNNNLLEEKALQVTQNQKKVLFKKENILTKKTEIKKIVKKEPKPINIVSSSEKENLNELSLQLEKLLKKRQTPLKNNSAEESTDVTKEKFHIISNPSIIYRDEEFSIPIH